MPAQSENQRQAAGAALDAKREGNCSKLPEGSASRSMCENMSEQQLKEYASSTGGNSRNTTNSQKGRKYKVLHRD